MIRKDLDFFPIHPFPFIPRPPPSQFSSFFYSRFLFAGGFSSQLYKSLRFVVKASSPVQALLISQASNLNRDYEQALILALPVRLVVLKSKSFH